ASNVMILGSGPSNGVLLKFCMPSITPLEAVGARIPRSKIEVVAAASRRADAKTTPLLRDMFRRILVFIRCLSFLDDYFSFTNGFRSACCTKSKFFRGLLFFCGLDTGR